MKQLLKTARIYDGTGGAPCTGDVLIEDDRIGKLFINGKLVLDGSELNEDALKTTGRAIPVLGTQRRQGKMKKYRNTGKMIGIFTLALALLVSLTACGSPAQTKPASQPAPESSASTDRTARRAICRTCLTPTSAINTPATACARPF